MALPADLCALALLGSAPLHVYFLSELPYEARTYQIVKVVIKKGRRGLCQMVCSLIILGLQPMRAFRKKAECSILGIEGISVLLCLVGSMLVGSKVSSWFVGSTEAIVMHNHRGLTRTINANHGRGNPHVSLIAMKR